ncbi:MAG: hypothetical protein ACRDMV_18005 [Streptosporangiales bacterium]
MPGKQFTVRKRSDVVPSQYLGEIHLYDEDGNALEAGQGPKGNQGEQGVSVTDISSDGTNLTFTMSDSTTHVVAWPAQ